MSRISEQSRVTAETNIRVRLDLDGAGQASISTGVGFFDHMLTLLAKHSGFDLQVNATGDLTVDPHHTVEDIGIVLGDSLRDALGDRSGIRRYGTSHIPMDEALVRSVVDLSGRPFCHFSATVRARRLGTFDTELVEDFLQALATHGRFAVHVDMIRGRNSHHIVEAVFKSLARSLGEAAGLTGSAGIPSTKGTLTE